MRSFLVLPFIIYDIECCMRHSASPQWVSHALLHFSLMLWCKLFQMRLLLLLNPSSLPSWKRRLLAPPHPRHLHRECLGPRLHQSHKASPPASSHAQGWPGGLCPAESWHKRPERHHADPEHPRPLWPVQPVRTLHADGWTEPEPRGESREALVVELLYNGRRPCTDVAAQTLLALLGGDKCGFKADWLAFMLTLCCICSKLDVRV